MKDKQFPKPLQRRVNRLAHIIALKHEPHIKSELLERLRAAREAGATDEAMAQLLDEIESQRSTARCVLQ